MDTKEILGSMTREDLEKFGEHMLDKNVELDQENRILETKLFACGMIFLAIATILALKIFNV